MPIVDLRKKLKEKMGVGESTDKGKLLAKLVEKLDHRCGDRITWSEFLSFLENEGHRREIVNDAQIYGMGVKRLSCSSPTLLKPSSTDYYIDCLCYTPFKQFRLLLALFENNDAKVMDVGTSGDGEVIQVLQFDSEYGKPKDRGE